MHFYVPALCYLTNYGTYCLLLINLHSKSKPLVLENINMLHILYI
uniref:Uncharacterized protein n=1 Tax=Arundo donax TaxID=35708 RepID=A0A0A9H416_ARUDO